MEAIEILKYIQERASGVGQAPNYTHKDFYDEMVKMYREQLKELESKNKK